MGQPAQQQDVPGLQSMMNPVPDCGETSYRGSGKLPDKAAVITGGDSGIGRAVAIAYAREGADVLISYLSEDDDAEETASLVEDAGRTRRPGPRRRLRPAALPQTSCDRAVRRVRPHRRPGEQRRVPDDPRDARRDPRRGVGATRSPTNVEAMFHLCKAAVPHMAAGLVDHRQLVGQLRHALADAGALRRDQGRDRQLLRQPGPDARATGDPGEQRRARPDLDAADPLDDAAGEGRELRRRHAAGPRRLSRRSSRRRYVLLASDEGSYISGARVAVTGGRPIL